MEDLPHDLHRMMDGEKEYAVAIEEVIDRAERTLHIFDIDLAAGGYNTVQRFEAIRDFLVRSRMGSLVVVLHETAYLERHCPRLINLLKLYSHRISILKTHEHGRVASDPFVIADEAHYVHRFHVEGAQALLAFEDHAGARALEERFQQLMGTASPAVSATTLGL